jgi:hypothetical protein
MKLRVALNGLAVNPYHALGLTQNPFPQLGKAEYDYHVLRVQSLGGDPIPDAGHIRRHLKGFSSEFVDLCVRKFEKGSYVEFDVYWPINPQTAKDENDVGSD